MIDIDSFRSAAQWCFDRRYFYDGVIPDRINVLQQGGVMSGTNFDQLLPPTDLLTKAVEAWPALPAEEREATSLADYLAIAAYRAGARHEAAPSSPATAVFESAQKKFPVTIAFTQMSNTLTVNGVEYVRADSAICAPPGSRAVVVVDRGWIFAGNVTRDNGRITLSRAVLVFKWDSCGFAKIIENPQNADIRPIANV